MIPTPGSLLQVAYGLIALLLGIYFSKLIFDPLRHIPTVGRWSDPLLSYLDARRFLQRAKGLVEEGYSKHYNGVFKVAMPDQWLVVVCGRKLVDDLRKRPSSEFSFVEGVQEFIRTKYTLGPDSHNDPYHITIVKDKMTRNLDVVVPGVGNEIELAVREYIPAGNDWAPVDFMQEMNKIVSRASNRAFVGLPLCRNAQYVRLTVAFMDDLVKDRNIINRYPKFLKGLVGSMVNNMTRTVHDTYAEIKWLIDERKAMLAEHGENWDGKPNDVFQSIVEHVTIRKSPEEFIAQRLLLANFAAIITTTISITHVLYHLIADPTLIKTLREEVESIVANEGWSKAALDKMWKVDSIFKESQRFNGINILSIFRKAMQDTVLADGTHIPKGTLIAAAAYGAHHDDDNYANAMDFDAFRFARLRATAPEGSDSKFQFVNTANDFLGFGHGKGACPGRFFASLELKMILAYLLLNYDFKFADGSSHRPQNVYFGINVFPNPCGRLVFRRRRQSSNGV